MLFTVCQSAVPSSCSEGTHTIALLCEIDSATEDGLQIDSVGQANLQWIVAATLFKPNLGRGLSQLSRQQTGLQHETSKW